MVAALESHELRVGSRFHNGSITKDIYFVCLDNRAQSMSDSDCCPARLHLLEPLLDGGFRL